MPLFGPQRDRQHALDVLTARDRQRDGAVLVDVREVAEWRQGHAPGAKHILLGELSGRLAELRGIDDVLFVCQSGGRSGVATTIARRSGLEARNVEGGMQAWSRAGLPVER